MGWIPMESNIVPQGIDEIASSAKMPVGSVVRAYDSALGQAEFIYGKGVASCAVGSVCSFDEAGQASLAVANGKGRIGVAMSACVAGKYGFFQISGKAYGKVATSFADNSQCYLTSTAGTVDDADIAGDLIKGMMGRSAIDSDGNAYFEMNRPFIDDSADD